MKRRESMVNFVRKATERIQVGEDCGEELKCGHRNNVVVVLSSGGRAKSTDDQRDERGSLVDEENSGDRSEDDKHSGGREDSECCSENEENIPARKQIRIDSRPLCNKRGGKSNEERTVLRQKPEESCRSRQQRALPRLLCIDGSIIEQSPLLESTTGGLKRKIPRPANAFMLFANEWRKKLAAENPRESNKDISVRLGILWKNMTKDVKEKYFALARQVDAEHKRKYPDYVYNPKEARLRKAMREQNREMTRRSILQNAIANANGRTTGIAGPAVSVSVSGGFLEHRHRFACVSAGNVPPMPIQTGSHQTLEAQRFAEPWFQNAIHRSKQQVLSPRVTDWYGNVDGDPIERLQAMDAMQQRAANAEKLSKDSMRAQSAGDCATAFPTAGYSAEYGGGREGERVSGEHITAEFADGQKWHPYQNDASPHSHPRTPHPSSQIGGMLHPGMQSGNSHPHGHGAWNQFCHGVLPHGPSMSRNVAIRGPRHAVFLRDRLPSRQCGYPEEATRMSYAPNKLEVDGARVAYRSPQDHQMRMLESTMESSIDSRQKSRQNHQGNEGTRWETNTVGSGIPVENLATQTIPQQGRESSGSSGEKERENRRSSERFEARKKTSTKQPLPGFHQAFGSTEIGRFSRSEFFVNMVGENNGSMNVGEATDEEELIPEAYITTPLLFPVSPASHGISRTSTSLSQVENDILPFLVPEDCYCLAVQSGRIIARIPNPEMRLATTSAIAMQQLNLRAFLRPIDEEYERFSEVRKCNCSAKTEADDAVEENSKDEENEESRDRDEDRKTKKDVQARAKDEIIEGSF